MRARSPLRPDAVAPRSPWLGHSGLRPCLNALAPIACESRRASIGRVASASWRSCSSQRRPDTADPGLVASDRALRQCGAHGGRAGRPVADPRPAVAVQVRDARAGRSADRSSGGGAPPRAAGVPNLDPLLRRPARAHESPGNIGHREGDIRHVRLGIVGAMLVLDFHPGAKPLQIEAVPIDADLVTDPSGLLSTGSPPLGHSRSSFVGLTACRSGKESGRGAIWCRSRTSDES